jgi:hypothetical protein
MPVRTSEIISKTLDAFPAPIMRHLAILWSAKVILADTLLHAGNYCDDGVIGAGVAFDTVLKQLQPEPGELCKLQTRDGRMQDGMRLKHSLFRPLRGISLTPWQANVYRAALHTAEIQLRHLYDSANVYADYFVGES